MERRLAAILAADVVGYSRLMAIDETGTHRRLRNLRKGFLEPVAARHHGRIIKLMGDGALVEFPSVVDAVTCAIEIQEGLAERQRDLGDEKKILFRIGLNIGDVIFDEDDVYGDGVNIAARLEPLADPGGICVSRTVVDYTKGKLDIDFEPMGEQRVKNIPEAVEVFRVGSLSAQPGRKARPSWYRTLLAAGALVIVLIAVALWLQFGDTDRVGFLGNDGAGASGQPSLAVMPFENLGGDAEEDYFTDGLTEDLITELSQISGLLVIARSSVFQYKDRLFDVREVARELGVRFVLEGSVRRWDGHLRVNMKLIDSTTGEHVWADRLDSDASDIFKVQDEVIGHIVEALAVELSPAEKQRLSRLPTTNLEAYDYYLRAEQALRSGYRPQLSAALSLYEKATALDPEFAQAYAADARVAAHVLLNNYDNVLQAPVARKRAYEHASRALEIDPEAPAPFSVLAILQVVDGRHDEAIRSAKRAVTLGPSDANAYSALSLVLTSAGRHAEAVDAAENALRLNPEPPTWDRIVAATAFLLNGQTERSIEILEAARERSPQVDDVHAMLAASYALDGRDEEARQSVAEVLRITPILCVEVYRVSFAQFRDERDLQLILDALSAAGLPKWPYGFTANEEDRLSGAEIEALTFGRIWKGSIESGGPAMMQISDDGTAAIRSISYFVTGTVQRKGDTLCETVDALSSGRTVCGPIYMAAPGKGDENTYTYVNATKVFHFSPVE